MKREHVRGGFTLLELLLVIALVGILVTLLLPTLGLTRDRAMQTKAMSDLRQHATVMGMYAGDWDDLFPFFAIPGASETVIRTERYTESFSYFDSHSFWPVALVDRYYPGTAVDDEVFQSPYARQTSWSAWGAYAYSCSMIAAPDYWDQSTREGIHQLRPNWVSSVRYPGSKALLSFDPWRWSWPARQVLTREGVVDRTTLIATVSGGVDRTTVGELGETIQTGDGHDPALGFVSHRQGWTPSGMHTLRGVEGRDLP